MEEKKTKVCSKCGRELPLEMFAKDIHSPDGLTNRCKPCVCEYNKLIRENKKKAKAAAQHAANLAGVGAERITTAEGKTYKKVVPEPVCKSLADYKSVELFAELKRRDYKWPDNTIYKKMYVNWDKIEI